MKRIITLTYEVSSSQSSNLAQAIDKVLTRLPKSAPITTIQQTDNSELCDSYHITFDLRYIPSTLWSYTKLQLRELEAKEISKTHL
jgi:hypothetical protein